MWDVGCMAESLVLFGRRHAQRRLENRYCSVVLMSGAAVYTILVDKTWMTT